MRGSSTPPCALPIGVHLAASEEQRHLRVRRLAEVEFRFDPLLIAATAHAHRGTLYTRDPADLAGLEDAITWRVV